MAPLEIDGAALAEELFRAYLKQILVDGFFHADPHPGNVFLPTTGGSRCSTSAWSRDRPRLQEHLLKLLLAVGEGRSEEAADSRPDGRAQARLRRAGVPRRVADLVGRHQDVELRNMQVGKGVLEIGRIPATRAPLPSELTMLGKTLLNLDQIAGRSTEFDPNASIRRNAAEIMRRRMLKRPLPGTCSAACSS